MRWLLLPFRFVLYFPFYAVFGSLRWLTHDYDRFVKLGSKIFITCFVLWFTAAMSGHRLTVYFPPNIPFWWYVIFIIILWCSFGKILSSRPIQRIFGGIANYCGAAILPPPPRPKPRAVKPAKKPPPPVEYLAQVASKNVSKSADVETSYQALPVELKNLLNS